MRQEEGVKEPGGERRQEVDVKWRRTRRQNGSIVSMRKERVSGRNDWSTLYIFKGQRI